MYTLDERDKVKNISDKITNQIQRRKNLTKDKAAMIIQREYREFFFRQELKKIERMNSKLLAIDSLAKKPTTRGRTKSNISRDLLK